MKIDVIGDTVSAFVTSSELSRTGNTVTHHVPAGAASAVVDGGFLPFSEQGLQQQVEQQVGDGRLCLCHLGPSVAAHSIVFLSVQPGQLAATEELVAGITFADQSKPVLVNQTACAVGTSEKLRSLLAGRFPNVAVVAFPDVLQEGVSIDNFRRPAHILLGCDDEAAERLVREVLRPFGRRRDIVQVMSSREAEFAKLAISAMLATRISFMNDMAGLAEQVGVDIEKVRQGMGADPRIGHAYLYPGCGFGGPGFSRDVMSLADSLKGSDLGAELLERVLEINDRQKELLFRKFWRFFGAEVNGRTVAIWGVSFKPETNRIQNAPSLDLIKALLAQGVTVRVHDPVALPELRQLLGEPQGLVYCDAAMHAVKGADALMLVTEWKQYWNPDWDALKQLMATPLVLDGRNIYDPAFTKAAGFHYQGVGRLP